MKNSWKLKPNIEMNDIYEFAMENFPKIADRNELEKMSVFFKALGDETRLKIIAMLTIEDLCMCEIVAGLEGASSTISHHLKIMEKGGVIEARREGKFTIFRLNKEKLHPFISYLKKEGELNV